MRRLARARISVLLTTALVSVGVIGLALPAASVTQSQVDAACADSKDAYERYQWENGLFEEATERFQTTSSELEETALRGSYLRGRIDDQTSDVIDIRERVRQRAVEMYITGAQGLSNMLFASTSVGQILAGQEFIEAATERDAASLDRLGAIKNDLSGLRIELQDQEARLAVLRGDQERAKDQLSASTDKAYSAWQGLSSECRALEIQRSAELARQAALEAARRGGAAGGIPPSLTPNFSCPMDPGPTHFINDWGFARSGGRTHKGTDLFASYGQPVYAAGPGVVSLGNGGLGGTTVWLTIDYGVAVYYAHLSGFAPGLNSGDRVSGGQLIGYNGDSGNARGGSPHVHLQLHPGGRGSPAVNPFPTLANFGCR